MMRAIVLSLLAAAPLAAPAMAAPGPQADMVRTLEIQAQVRSTDAGTQIELAQAYLRADRPADAERAYRRALALDNEMMVTPTGDSIWSHEVAKRMLARNISVATR